MYCIDLDSFGIYNLLFIVPAKNYLLYQYKESNLRQNKTR